MIYIDQTEIKEMPFTRIPNTIIFDKRISNAARGLFMQMCAVKGDTWRPSISGFSQLTREGSDAVKRQVKELERYGYIERGERYRDERGYLRDAVYTLHVDPQGLMKGSKNYIDSLGTKLYKSIGDKELVDKVMNVIRESYEDSDA